ncbi:hypothetical protein MVEN_01643100 [Mycena venus]|uniref:Uncharacterized protein n=1 Tax=Mycena venus TaxID=2733690 RepID=A0A8H6XQC6_9AGAR|nr:hypothetical protein MVEN_01643100 [Mycena venus]
MSVLACLNDPVLQVLILTQTITFIQLLSLLKDDIILTQCYYIPTTEALLVLPASIIAFVAESTGIHVGAITGCWDILKEDIWASPTPEQMNQDDELFGVAANCCISLAAAAAAAGSYVKH